MARSELYTNVYDLDYFSGSQMYLYVGDVWIDEITSLQYTTQQMKQPLYGYASQLFDDCAAGHVIVQGSFTINFKEQGYLWAVLRRYQKVMGADIGFNTPHDNSLMKTRKGSSRNQPDLTNSKGVRVGSNGTQISRQPIEGMVNGNLTRGQQYQFYQDLAGYATFNTKQAKDKVFEDIAEAFEDQIWKKGITDEDLISQVRRPDDNIFDNFDMYVVFGNMANPQANHTVQKIIGVRLISQGKSIMVGGAPINEEYQFIARTTA